MDFASKLMERTGKGYLSYSAIKYAADGADEQDMKLFELYMKGLLKKESDAMTFGSLYDTLLLEPHTLGDKFYVIYDEEKVAELESKYKNPRASKEYKDWIAEETKSAGSKRIVNNDLISKAEDMILRLDESHVAMPDTGEIVPVRHFITGEVQKEILSWIGDIPVRGFLDVRGDGFITDSKTTRSISGFRYDVFKRCYDIQAYIYTQVEGVSEFYWAAQTTNKPYTVAIYKATPQTLARGEEKFWSAVNNIARWLDDPSVDSASFAIYSEI